MELLDRARGLVGSLLEGLVEAVEEGSGFVEFIVRPGVLVEAARRLKDAGFDHVVSVTAVDYPRQGRLKVVYHVSSYTVEDYMGVVVGLGAYVERGDRPVIPSLTPIWPSAEFQEREVFEFFGIEFEGHPDLKPLLLIPPLAEKRPLRKDYVVREESIYEGVPFSYERRG